MSARARIAAALALAFTVGLGACSLGGGSDAAEVTVLIAEGPEELETFEAIVDAYNQSQSATHATIIPVSEDEDLITRLSTSIASGNPPDVFFANYRYVDAFVAKDLLSPITDRLSTSTVVSADDFYPVSVDAYKIGGEQYCMPFNASSLAVYYNETLFEKAGLDAPADDWTWRDMVSDATALTGLEPVAGGERTSGIGMSPEFIRLMPLVWSEGGEVADAHENPTKLTMTSLPAQRALTAFLNLNSRDHVVPSAALTDTEGLDNLFANGHLGMYVDSRKVVPPFRAITDFEWNVAPLPSLGEPSTILHSDGYCIPNGTNDPEGAWDFIEFAVSQPGQEIGARTGRAVPSMISVGESEAFLDPTAPPSRSKIFLDQLAHARTVPVMEDWVEVEDLTNGILEEGFFSGGSAAEIGDLMNRQTKPLLSGE